MIATVLFAAFLLVGLAVLGKLLWLVKVFWLDCDDLPTGTYFFALAGVLACILYHTAKWFMLVQGLQP